MRRSIVIHMPIERATPAARGTRRRPRREDVRRDLLEAAARVFARRGIDGASVDDIAAEAGYTKGAVYSNYGSKKALIDAVVLDRTSTILEFGFDAAASTDGPITEKARALGDRLDATRADQRDWLLLYLELWQRSVRDETMAREFRSHHHGNLNEVATAVQGQLEDSEASVEFSPDELAVVISALTTGTAMEAMISPDAVQPGLLGRVLAKIVAH